MSSYNPPVLGKIGLRSSVSKKMAFGICCDTKKEARDELRNAIGWDAAKWRFKTASWNKADMKEYEDYLQELKAVREKQELDRKEKREKALFIKANINKLKDEYIEKFNKSFTDRDRKTYHNVRSAYNVLNEWLKMPERVKEQHDD